ncbi:MAG: SdiA-regulated domain-containing protein [Deltaproteobacteria bacterium]|nr:SdiA-regulated domain-containing protein [Deltaproteobacteria bacterium]
MNDFSEIHHDPNSDHIFLLRNESRRIIELSRNWMVVDKLELRKGKSGLKDDIPQAEGLALAPDGTLYVCSDPNLLYIFRKT